MKKATVKKEWIPLNVRAGTRDKVKVVAARGGLKLQEFADEVVLAGLSMVAKRRGRCWEIEPE
jgi:hypothetical protein